MNIIESQVVENELMEIPSTDALGAITRAEIDIAVATAKRYPRNLKNFRDECHSLACIDEETAATMFYSLPRGGKKIEGPSVRFAEIVGYAWGNLRYGARIVSIDDRFITAQGICTDLEKNNSGSVEVQRRITDSTGNRYKDDMIVVTGNAACSIALRNAIFKIVPFGLAKSVYLQAMAIVKGDASSLNDRRQRALEWFLKAGATEGQVLQALERSVVDEITLDDLVTLSGMRTAIKDGESTIEEILGPVPDRTKKVKRSALNEKAAEPAKQVVLKTITSDRPDGFINGYDESSEPFTDWYGVMTMLGTAKSEASIEDFYTQFLKQMRNESDVAELKRIAFEALGKLTGKKK